MGDGCCNIVSARQQEVGDQKLFMNVQKKARKMKICM